MLKKVISGGQTGVDRAGLDAAMKAGIPVGGCCPRGRLAEDGVTPDIYSLTEFASSELRAIVEQNVINSDGTLILNEGDLTHGTKLTELFAVMKGRPRLVVQLDAEPVIEAYKVIRWVKAQFISTLNIAGPRESKCPGIYHDAYSYLEELFKLLKEEPRS